MTDWQPIESAPRGEYVLVFRAGVPPSAKTDLPYLPAHHRIVLRTASWQPLPEPPAD